MPRLLIYCEIGTALDSSGGLTDAEGKHVGQGTRCVEHDVELRGLKYDIPSCCYIAICCVDRTLELNERCCIEQSEYSSCYRNSSETRHKNFVE